MSRDFCVFLITWTMSKRSLGEKFWIVNYISLCHSNLFFAQLPAKTIFRDILISRLNSKLCIFRGILISRFFEINRDTAKFSCRESFMQ